MRVSGITIPKEKRVVIALTYVKGIGETTAKNILAQAQIDESVRVADLKPEQEDRIREMIEGVYKTEGDLRREVQGNIKRLIETKSYRGTRHSKRLPVRGQRTKTNSRTRRGNKRNIATSGRAKSAAKT